MGYRYVTPDQTLLFGVGAASELAGELSSRDIKRVCVLSSPRASRSAAAQLVERALSGCDVVLRIEDVRQHAPIVDTERWAVEVGPTHPDAIVAVGGGSVSDTAKGMAILLAEGGTLEDHCSTFTPPDQLRHVDLRRPKIPVVSVPTTLSGAEITPGGGATNAAGVKRVFWDPKVASRVVLFDPAAIADVDHGVLATTSMNGLAHCAEALYSRTRNPLSSALAREGARQFAEGLLGLAQAGANQTSPLASLQVGAAIGGAVISNARVGLHHAICHVLGASRSIPHGVANSIMLPYVLQFNYSVTRAEQDSLIEAMRQELSAHGVSTEGTPAVVMARFQRAVGVPRRLSEVGLTESDLPAIANDVMQDRGLYFNPKPVTSSQEPLEVLRGALSGSLLENGV